MPWLRFLIGLRFLVGLGFLVVTFFSGPPHWPGPPPSARDPPWPRPRGRSRPLILLRWGRSGVKTSILGLGTGTRGGSEQRAMGSDAFTKMVRGALERGIRFIDTAHTYQMHVDVQRGPQRACPVISIPC